MAYKLLPPGSYYFWYLGSQNSSVRWTSTAALWIIVCITWYLCVHIPLIRLCAPSSRNQEIISLSDKIGELAHTESSLPFTSYDTQTCMFELLALYDAHKLTLQSSSCQKPVTKQNSTTQRITCVAHGTLTAARELMDALRIKTVPLTAVTVTLHHHHAALYIVTTHYECMVTKT